MSVSVEALVGAIAGSTVLSSAVTAFAARRPSLVGAMTEAYVQLANRVGTLESKVNTLEANLGLEQRDHAATRGALERSLSFLRELLAWCNDQQRPQPEVPLDLAVLL